MVDDPMRRGDVEYKTVALPGALRIRRRRLWSYADVLSETMTELINAEAKEGWRFTGAETISCLERRGFFGRREAVPYCVLVFERPVTARRAAKAEAPTETLRPRSEAAPQGGKRVPALSARHGSQDGGRRQFVGSDPLVASRDRGH